MLMEFIDTGNGCRRWPACPTSLRKQLVIEIAAAMAGSVDVQRARPEIRAGDIGIHCKAYGAACLPVYARYMLEEVSLP